MNDAPHATDVQRLLEPTRERPEIEWSMTMTRDGYSADRFVIYGLEPADCLAFLGARGVEGERAFSNLRATYGPPSQVAIGKDGRRTKLYWFLPSDDPYFIGVDFQDGPPLPPKTYRQLHCQDRADIYDLLDPQLASTVRWLLAQDPFHGDGLFHMVLFARDEAPPYAGVHLGLSPDWVGLLRHDAGLLQADLVRRFLDQLGFGQHWDACQRHMLGTPMAWTCYVSVQVRPNGELGATIYGRSSPVVRLTGGLALVEPGEGGTFPRPVAISFTHAELGGVSVRMRSGGPERSFLQSNGWKVDYSADRGDASGLGEGALAKIRTLSLGAAAVGSPFEPADVYDWLCAQQDVHGVEIGPDLRRHN